MEIHLLTLLFHRPFENHFILALFSCLFPSFSVSLTTGLSVHTLFRLTGPLYFPRLKISLLLLVLKGTLMCSLNGYVYVR